MSLTTLLLRKRDQIVGPKKIYGGAIKWVTGVVVSFSLLIWGVLIYEQNRRQVKWLEQQENILAQGTVTILDYLLGEVAGTVDRLGRSESFSSNIDRQFDDEKSFRRQANGLLFGRVVVLKDAKRPAIRRRRAFQKAIDGLPNLAYLAEYDSFGKLLIAEQRTQEMNELHNL